MSALLSTRYLLVISLVIHSAELRQNGAPISACSSMLPVHDGAVFNQTRCPFVVKSNKLEIDSQGIIALTLEGAEPNKFAGFFVMAFNSSETTNNTQVAEPIGNFRKESDTVKLVSCSENIYNAVTHLNEKPKSSVTMYWSPPTDFEGDIVFKATFAASKQEIWTDVQSETVRIRRVAGDDDIISPPTDNQTETTSTSLLNTTVYLVKPTTDFPGNSSSAPSISLVALYGLLTIGLTIAIMA